MFDSASLELPEVEVFFHDDQIGCSDNFGLFQAGFEPWSIQICSSNQWVLVHELAHAWVAANLTDTAMNDYLRISNLGSWDNGNVPWRERGIEHSAIVIQQILMSSIKPGDPSFSREWERRHELFTSLIDLAGTRDPVPRKVALQPSD